ncbi:MAG: thiamine-phosphate kinase [Deltaproteobacteria bacterium]|nr:thiamine-phosphate kinase [Deltaproteobacteria bacterium]
MREFDWIAALAERFGRTGPGVTVGIGSDCAVLAPAPATPIVTIDTMVQSVHFDLDYMTWADAGYRAVTTALSDLAAGGADPDLPIVAFLSAAIPATVRDEDLAEMRDGMAEAFEKYGVTLGGGDTVAIPGPMVLTCTFIGHAPKPMTRDGAKVGDAVMVAGHLGAAGAAVHLLRNQQARMDDDALLAAYRRPEALIGLGRALADLGATACADVSDGLLADAAHIAEQSGLALHLSLDAIPTHPALAAHPAFDDEERLRLSATAGDDYALVFTVPRDLVGNTVALAARFRVPCVHFGECVEGRPGAIESTWRGEAYTPEKLGYEH